MDGRGWREFASLVRRLGKWRVAGEGGGSRLDESDSEKNRIKTRTLENHKGCGTPTILDARSALGADSWLLLVTRGPAGIQRATRL